MADERPELPDPGWTVHCPWINDAGEPCTWAAHRNTDSLVARVRYGRLDCLTLYMEHFAEAHREEAVRRHEKGRETGG